MVQLRRGARAIEDGALEALLSRVYVEGGFTAPEVAEHAFAPSAVRARGELIVAYAPPAESLAGMVIVVLPDSSARRIASPDEAELHLLAVLPEFRGAGIGSRLIAAAIDVAKQAGLARLVLWTQPSMLAAQRLYLTHGFVRRPERDAALTPPAGRSFWVFERSLLDSA